MEPKLWTHRDAEIDLTWQLFPEFQPGWEADSPVGAVVLGDDGCGTPLHPAPSASSCLSGVITPTSQGCLGEGAREAMHREPVAQRPAHSW